MMDSKNRITLLGDFAPIGSSVEDAIPRWRPFEIVRDAIGSDVRLVANLEAPLTSSLIGRPFKWANLRADPTVVRALDGLDVAVLANNHISDYGTHGATETMRLLDENGVRHVGYGSNLVDSLRPTVLTIGENNLGVVALCCPTTNGENLATHVSEGVAPLGMELLAKSVLEAKSRCDAVIVYMHWGCEWVHDPVPEQMRLARQAIDCGADAVVGCHSHTIQSYEQYLGRWIFYGLGNLFFGDAVSSEVLWDGSIRSRPLQFAAANRESLAVTFSFQKKHGNGCLSLESVRFFKQRGALAIDEIHEGQLSFDLPAANAKLADCVTQNDDLLSKRDEVVFRSRFTSNGVMGYLYSGDSLTLPQRPSLSRRIRNRFKLLMDATMPAIALRAVANLRRNLRPQLQKLVLHARIRLKWYRDKQYLPLQQDHWELFHICHKLYWNELRDLPNLVNPRDFNDRIQWLKLFDQSEDMVRCSDKIQVRDFIRERVGDSHVTNLYQTCFSFSEINFHTLPDHFVIKTNHDSGSVVLVRDKSNINYALLNSHFETALKRQYGWENGEWAYSLVRPQLLIEEFIGLASDSPPADYKFYVVMGQIKFVHYIYDRGSETKEQLLTPDGVDMKCSLYPSFSSGTAFCKPKSWEKMKEIAVELGRGFKMVRVDLFNVEDRIYAGELTFWPMFGTYKGDGQKKLGHLLDFDRTTFKTPVYLRLRRPS